MKKEHTYRCPFCGSKRFIAHQVIRAFVVVGEHGDFVGNLPNGLESHVYDSEHPYGPYTCEKCNKEYDTLPVHETTETPRGTFTVVSGERVKDLVEEGYGYHHQSKSHVIVGNGRRAYGVTQEDYKRYFGGQKTFLL